MQQLVGLTTTIVKAYLTKNAVEPTSLPDLVSTVSQALASLIPHPEDHSEPTSFQASE